MPWTKFPNYINDLGKLRRALQVAAGLPPAQLDDDETYGYALLDAGVIASRTARADLVQLPRQRQSPITQGRGLPEMFILLGMMEHVPGEGLLLTDAGLHVAAQDAHGLTDAERDEWREAVLGLRFPHAAYPGISEGVVEMRPAHVVLSMLLDGPLPAQGLAFAFAAGTEADDEVLRLRGLAEEWGDREIQELAADAGTTASELRNNAKVFPGLLEQCGLIRRDRGIAYIEPEGLHALGAHGDFEEAPAAEMPQGRRQPRRIQADQPRAWVPDPVGDDDAAERANLRILRAEKANRRHQEALLLIAAELENRNFETWEADYDILARRDDVWLLIEVKSTSARNARKQTMTALGQLAFYRQNIEEAAAGDIELQRILAFDRPVRNDRIQRVLDREQVDLTWIDDGQWVLPNEVLANHIRRDQ